MKLYWKYVKMHFRSQLQYRGAFFLLILGQFLSSFSALLSIWFLLQRFHAVDGFSFSEVLLCFAAVLMAFSLAELFVRGFDQFPSLIRSGDFDRIMVRPRNEMLQVLGAKMEFSRIGRLIQAILVFCYAIPASGVSWTAGRILLLVLMIASGTAVFAGLFIIYAALCFFTTEGLEFINIFTDGGREFGAYPLSAYGRGVLTFFTFAVPLALVQYYPLLYLTGRNSSLFCLLCPLLAFLFLIPCFLLWRLGMRHYHSTGS